MQGTCKLLAILTCHVNSKPSLRVLLLARIDGCRQLSPIRLSHRLFIVLLYLEQVVVEALPAVRRSQLFRSQAEFDLGAILCGVAATVAQLADLIATDRGLFGFVCL